MLSALWVCFYIGTWSHLLADSLVPKLVGCLEAWKNGTFGIVREVRYALKKKNQAEGVAHW